jgi:hypothetical protein
MGWQVVFIFFLLIFISGCVEYGVALNEAECTSKPNTGAQMACYHSLALSYAYAGDEGSAAQSCNMIYNIGSNTGSGDSEKQGRVLKNQCFYDIAEATRNPALCSGITGAGVGESLLGFDTVSQNACYDRVDRLADKKPDRYYSNKENICSLVALIIPILAAALFFYRKGAE